MDRVVDELFKCAVRLPIGFLSLELDDDRSVIAGWREIQGKIASGPVPKYRKVPACTFCNLRRIMRKVEESSRSCPERRIVLCRSLQW